MGKTANARKRRRLAATTAAGDPLGKALFDKHPKQRSFALAPPTTPDSPMSLSDADPVADPDVDSDGADANDSLSTSSVPLGGISPRDLATTVATLSALEHLPAVLRGKECKALRIALHRLNAASAAAGIGGGTTLSGRVSDALADGRWNDALVLLAEMRERGMVPKLGALQRWVRDCDAVSGPDGGLKGQGEVLRVLDAILRTADPEMVPRGNGDVEDVVRRHAAWAPCAPVTVDADDAASATEEDAARYKAGFRVVAYEKGPERRTPNLHDFILYASAPGTIARAPATAPPVTRHDVPNVPGCFMLTDVLTPQQCTSILHAAETVGFTPDAPIVGAAAEQTSVLAHNLFWLADSDLLDAIFTRCAPHLPHTLSSTAGGGGGALNLRGINARWRVYRYVPGAVYRPHIDGAWPASGLDPVTGEYVYDLHRDQRSRLTFLVYLNDGFDGGHTTFFTPGRVEGRMDAWPVSPRAGAVLCFPHGEAKGALLHEGSAVERGAKYIIRADVLYDLPKAGART
ncbi:hypothetical protein BDZ88DRAFT_432262 [Geranomyces variabilis]|nr:hypothetical protein BDZ88DRAFT_432262 [Geranomyces variabilis]KAJ3140007.1 hypothetical protein HDU90_008910 [Geranomyces variabilis]